jgi:hypothetical protein
VEVNRACCGPERWYPIPGWPHEASTHGRIRRKHRLDAEGRWCLGGMVPQYIDKRPGKGYLYVTLLDGPRKRNAAVHVLVLEACAGRKPTSGHQGCHVNGIRTFNHRHNLYWGTSAQNRADRERHRHGRAVTDPVTKTPSVTPVASQERRFPRIVRSGRSVTSARLPGTGSFPPFQSPPSHFTSVQPILHTLRTPFHSLRNRQAA